MEDSATFGARLKQLRKQLNLSQRSFSARIGITASALSAYEQGQKNPSVNVAISIAKEYGVSLDWLCGITEANDKFRKDEYVSFDLPQALRGLLDMIGIRLLCEPETDELEEYGIHNVDVLDVSNPLLQGLIEDSEQIRLLYANKSISYKTMQVCLDELIYNTANEIQRWERRSKIQELEDLQKAKKEAETDGTPFSF